MMLAIRHIMSEKVKPVKHGNFPAKLQVNYPETP
jgi:hypothetical protein